MKKYKVRITRKQSIEIEISSNNIQLLIPGIILDARNDLYSSDFPKGF